MQALLAGAAAVDWRTVGTTSWTWVRAQSTAASAYLSALPMDCQLAALHTTLVCTGRSVQYHSYPGFGPIGLAWGWLMVGVVIGGIVCFLALFWMGRIRSEPTVMQLSTLMQPAGDTRPAVLPMRAQARADALHYIAVAGPPALQELAAAARMSESAFLAQLLSSHPASPPGLTINTWQ